jgi:6-pyruvoyl-tetrahydropterin synthase
LSELQVIWVKHNMEMAHRLFQTLGKCQAIHGHSWLVTLKLRGEVDDHGLLEGLDFGLVKRLFRGHLDSTFDHHLLLNKDDPFARVINLGDNEEGPFHEGLPGLQKFDGDPTTENIARAIGEWAIVAYGLPVAIDVFETKVNMASWPAEGFVTPE